MFLEDKDLMDTVSFECLIQQNPIDRFGLLFDRQELKFVDEYEGEGFQRNIAAVDVAWGGGDTLSMPICSEYENGDCPLIDVYISEEGKEITIPEVISKIKEHHITHCHFEANNGGDMYADAVREGLKKEGITWCTITDSKVPTTKAKLDRILASVGNIKGSPKSDYRLIFFRMHNNMYERFIDLLCKFSQSLKMQGKQKDDVPDSLANLFQNVLGSRNEVGVVHVTYSREELGI